jgi:hypothetical protein
MKGLYSDVEGVTNFEHLLNGVGLEAVVVAAPANITFPGQGQACLRVNIH